MTKTEEALCNGILFSVPRLVAPSVQEGELENALYYVYVLLSPAIDKLVLKIWKAPDYTPLQVKEEDVETFYIGVRHSKSEDENLFHGYYYDERAHESKGDHYDSREYTCNRGLTINQHSCGGIYNGLMIYPAVKCMMVDLIKEIIQK